MSRNLACLRQFVATLLLGWGTAQSLSAGVSPDYSNYGDVTAPLNIDALVFQNYGDFDIVNSFTVSNLNSSSSSAVASFTPFVTQDTLYFTNAGTMEGTPGFQFDTGTATTRFPAKAFYNSGIITGEDDPTTIYLVLNSTGDSINYPEAQGAPSDLLVYANTIVNANAMSVGNDGLLQMVGSNVTIANSSMVAGTISEIDPNDVTGREEFEDAATKSASYFVDPLDVYDLFWGVSNAAPFNVSTFVNPTGNNTFEVNLPGSPPVTTRGVGGSFIFGGLGEMTAYAFTNSPDTTNIYYNVVFLDTTTLPTNVTANVMFTFLNTAQTVPAVTVDDNAVGDIVQFSERINDVITGQTVTNSIYLLDSGAEVSAFSEIINASYVNGYSRPNPFEITTSQPDEWLFAQPTNANFDPTLVFAPGDFLTKNITINDAEYGAQIGRDPETVNGLFPEQTNLVAVVGTNISVTNFTVFNFIDLITVTDLPDMTNEPGRIELSGDNVTINNSRVRAEGVVSLTATNLFGAPLAKDWGDINADLNNTNGTLVVSNVFPTNFQRLRGQLTVWAGNFVNTQTNTPSGGVTNIFHYHVLWVEPALQGAFQSSVRNLALRATNNITTLDALRVINNSLFVGTNLDFEAPVTLTQNAGSFVPSNAPNLHELLIGTNGTLAVDNLIDIGFNTSLGHTPPTKRKYSVSSITNLGLMTAVSPLLEASNIETDGGIVANDGGSVVIEAFTLGMGTVLTNTNAGNYVLAGGNIILSANNMFLTNCQLVAGGVDTNVAATLTLESVPSGQITDLASSAPSTNVYTTNQWQVTGGFSLPVKPATGDLFGTEITTYANNYSVALHTWAGLDLGASSDGFSDNMVIGHLKLSRQSEGAQLHFTGAGSQNGMYVDYLELDPNSLSYTQYTNGLVIDPNLTIYFAACNVDPIKLTTVYSNRLVWVPSFVGPNSSVVIPSGSNGYCFANSSAYERAKLEGTNTTCVSDITTFRDYAVQTGPSNEVYLTIATSGDGSITPKLKQDQVALGKSYSLSASPAPGWVFSGWSGDGLPAEADVKSSNLRFTLEDNLSVTANFTPKTFTLVKGTYYGLFSETNGTAFPGNAGWFTLTVGASGAASGKLLVGPTTYTFSSKLPTNGFLSVTAVHGHDTIMVDFQFDMNESTGQVTGYVNGETNIQLLGNIAPTWTDKDSSPYAGRYTMILTNTATNSGPSAYSYGTVDVGKTGKVSVAGKLADGNSYSQTVPISMDGLWPFYAYTSSGQDFLLGWIPFEKGGVGSASIGATNVFWSKAAMPKSPYYPDGFTSSFAVVGSPYSFPGKNSTGLSLPNSVLVFSGGGLATSITNTVIGNGKLLVTGTNLSLTINPTTGTFAGKVKDIGAKPNAWMSGVILQNQESAFGFLLGTNNESEAVLLQNQ